MLYSYKMNLRFHLRPDRPDETGAYPLTLRITLLKQRAVIDTDIRLKPKDWDQSKQQVKGKGAADHNAELTDLKHKTQQAYRQLQREARPDRPATAANVKALTTGAMETAPLTVVDLSEQYLAYMSRAGMKNEPNTVRTFFTRHRALLTYLHKGLRKPALLGLEVTELTAGRYMDYMLDKGFAPVTIRRYVAWLRQVMTWARKQELVSHNELKGFRCEVGSTRGVPVFVSAADVARLWVARGLPDHLVRCVDAWLFCCETGLSFADYEQFNADLHLQTDERGTQWIRMVRRKMRKRKPEGFSVPLSPGARSLLERYRYQLPAMNNSNGNRYLKEVMEHVGIETHLTWKIARNTFAQSWLDRGVDEDTVAAMMGNTKDVVKAHYARQREEAITAKVIPLLGGESGGQHYHLTPTGTD